MIKQKKIKKKILTSKNKKVTEVSKIKNKKTERPLIKIHSTIIFLGITAFSVLIIKFFYQKQSFYQKQTFNNTQPRHIKGTIQHHSQLTPMSELGGKTMGEWVKENMATNKVLQERLKRIEEYRKNPSKFINAPQEQ